MINFMYILIILYNINLFLVFYIEIMLQMVTAFNYKNTISFNTKFSFFDILLYSLYKNNSFLKIFILNNK